MKAVLAVPGAYKPIQSVEVGAVIPIQLVVTVPPIRMLDGLALIVGCASARAAKLAAMTRKR